MQEHTCSIRVHRFGIMMYSWIRLNGRVGDEVKNGERCGQNIQGLAELHNDRLFVMVLEYELKSATI